ncbi:MAG: glycosyltransferase family 39 protein [Anaerolineae bacterium]|nr:glycosyltransferase family 39 protein [Anaerolineae bacterium]
MRFSRRELVLLALITLLAATLRLYRLDDIPPGLCGDTAYKGIGANRILAGDYPIFFAESWGGIEPMYMYLLAGLFKLLGSTPLAIKLLSAIIGIVTVPLLHLVARELLDSRAMGLLASTLLAISFWHISYSRLGWEIILGPPFVILTLYLLWRALKTNRWRDFVWTGLALGASLYTYQAQRFLPILIIGYLLYLALLERGFWKEYAAKVILCLAVAILVFAPLGLYFATHPDVFFRRAGEVSIFNPEKNPRGPLYSLALSTVKVLGTYNLQGDPLWRHNLPGRPAFDLLISVFFLFGFAVCLTRWRQRPYSLLMFWLVILTLPPILTPPRDVPHFSRSIGALPAACVFPAIGMGRLWTWWRQRRPSARAKVIAAFCVATIVAISTTLTVRDYFLVWARNPDLRSQYFDGQFVDVAEAMNDLDKEDGVWILPISALASPHDEPGHHTVEFLYQGTAPFHFLRLDESTVANELTRLTNGRDRVMLVDYKNYVLEEAYNYIDADPKRLLPFLLSKYSHEAHRYEFEAFDVRLYPVPAGTLYTIADSWHSASADFGGQLQLDGVSFGATGAGGAQAEPVPSGEEAWVVLRWQALTQPTADYKVSLSLLDQRGRVVGQVDKPLLSNHLRLTWKWEYGQEEMDYYLLPTLPATPPGDYDVRVVVYDPATMERLRVRSDEGTVLDDSFSATKLTIERPVSPAEIEPTYGVADSTLTADLSLLGYDLPRQDVTPGDRVEVALYWRAMQDAPEDYLVELQLRDAAGRTWSEEKGRPAYGTYATNLWKEDEVVRDWHELRVPAEAPAGDYSLHLIVESEGIPSAELQVGTIHVSGKARSYEIPPMQEELGWRLGSEITLLGYDLESSVKSGGMLHMTLYWKCLSEMSTSYTVFTHVLDSDSMIRGQVDRLPGSPEAPTTSWVQEEVIADPYQIPLDPDAPPGEYTVEVGMYDATTMGRLPAHDAQGAVGGDRVVLGTVYIEP